MSSQNSQTHSSDTVLYFQWKSVSQTLVWYTFCEASFNLFVKSILYILLNIFGLSHPFEGFVKGILINSPKFCAP